MAAHEALNDRSLQGKLAIVTGASRGIGAAIATNLASKSCNLVINFTSASSEQKTQDLAKSLQDKYAIKVIAVQADIGSEGAGQKIVDAARSAFPTHAISIIVNNAGVAGNLKLHEVTAESFHKQYNVNVLGPLLLIKAALPHLPNDRSGRIVNLSSVSSSLGYPGQSVYGGTKAALEAMTRTWSRELAERATVNAVNPGPVDTDMYAGVTDEFVRINKAWLENTPLSTVTAERDGEEAVKRFEPLGGRSAYADEIAGVVGMLVSKESGWCTGSVVCANGGMKMSF